jgi:hypothetical protein
MVTSVTLPGPDATQRMSPADKKDHLNCFGYWDLDINEQTWALFRNIAGPEKTIKEHHRIALIYQDLADEFYRRFKQIVVSNLNVDGYFCGGAFREKVKMTSPFTDIITFVLASPVLRKEHKTFFNTLIAKPYYEIVSHLRSENQNSQLSLDKIFWDVYEKKLEPITRAFVYARAHKDTATLPDDISDAWLEEFGPVFTANYKKALAGDPTAPFKVVKCIRNKQGLSKFCIMT